MKKVDYLMNDLMEELSDSWDYTTEELADIRSKLMEAYKEGWYDALDDKGFVAYGKKEDWE